MKKNKETTTEYAQVTSNANAGYFFIPIILIIGLSGILAQVLTLRELLISFQGNELTLGMIFANWVLFEALGLFSGEDTLIKPETE